MTWVKTRLALEDCAPGDVLVIRVRAGESHSNVSRNCRDFGHEVMEDVEEPPTVNADGGTEATGSGVRQLRVRVC